jgi:hypothetical protein
MCTLTHFSQPAAPRSQPVGALHMAGTQGFSALEAAPSAPSFQVIPAGNAFFHIREKSTGLVRGFRENHNDACALARLLESRIELLDGTCLR